jgi:carbamoyl-phosphate synthase/aspartate carbamoyltransferase/dihydroorotase
MRDFTHIYSPPKIDGNFMGKHIVTVEQFGRKDLQILFDAAISLRKRLRQNDRGLVEVCSGKVMAMLFFESSTRTDMSFQAAMVRLGGEVIGASNGVQFSSVYKGEDLADTVRAAGCYADVVVLRHPDVGSSFEAAYYLDRLNDKIARQPLVMSAGDGIGEHPTQALLDMFTIVDLKGSIDDLTITMVGDLRHGRTVHSLAKLIARYEGNNVNVCLVAPPSLRMPSSIVDLLKLSRVTVMETEALNDVLGMSDVIYWTRVQEERFSDPSEYDSIKNGFIMTPPILSRAKPDTILMHPLPRKHEMGTADDHDVLDADPRAVYFRQMENGMFIRMALLAKVLRGMYV